MVNNVEYIYRIYETSQATILSWVRSWTARLLARPFTLLNPPLFDKVREGKVVYLYSACETYF